MSDRLAVLCSAGLGCWRWVLFILLLQVALPVGSLGQRQGLRPLPDVDLIEGVEPTVVEIFSEGVAGIETLLLRPDADSAQLAEAYGELGRAALYYQIEELLVPCLENAGKLAPEEFRWPYYLGAFYHDERRLEDAVALLERAHQLDPENLPTLIRLGRLALLTGRPEESRGYFQQASEFEEFTAVALYGLGRAAIEAGETEAAIEYFLQALELQPNAAEIHQQLGLAYRELQDLDAARRHLSADVQGELMFPDPLMGGLKAEFMRSHVFAGLEAETSGRWEEAVVEYRLAVESQPENGVYHQALANALREVGDLDGAVAEHRQAVLLLPGNGMARVLLARTVRERDGVTDEVVELFEEAIELAPEVEDAHLGLARALHILERYEEASVHFEAALELAPEDHTARLQWARALMQLGQDERAVSELELIIQDQPDRMEALLSYGQVLGRLGDLDGARAQLQKVVDLERGEDATRAVANAALGDVLEAQGSAEEALVHYRAAVDIAPELEPLQLSLAGALGRAGLFEEEAGVYETMLFLNPANEVALLGRARALTAADRGDQAERELASALETSPRLLEVRLELAALHVRQGNLDAAAELLEDALVDEEIASRRALLLFELAGIRQLRGDDEAAVELYSRVIAQRPDLRDAHFNVAVSLGRLGRTEEAVSHLRRAVEIDPTDEGAYLALAQTLATEGRFAESRDVLERGLEAASRSPLLSGALARLLIASPDPTVRDAAQAVPLAMRLHEAQPTLQNTAMVAAALGAAGRFEEAVDWQEEVVAQAEAAGVDAERLSRMRSDLDLYRERAGGGS